MGYQEVVKAVCQKKLARENRQTNSEENASRDKLPLSQACQASVLSYVQPQDAFQAQRLYLINSAPKLPFRSSLYTQLFSQRRLRPPQTSFC